MVAQIVFALLVTRKKTHSQVTGGAPEGSNCVIFPKPFDTRREIFYSKQKKDFPKHPHKVFLPLLSMVCTWIRSSGGKPPSFVSQGNSPELRKRQGRKRISTSLSSSINGNHFWQTLSPSSPCGQNDSLI